MEWRDEYQISPHRYRELKHFCLQYNEWKQECDRLSQLLYSDGTDDPTSKIASLLADYICSMRLIETTVRDSSGRYANAVFKSITEDIPLSAIGVNGLEAYRRRFFWLLSERKGY